MIDRGLRQLTISDKALRHLLAVTRPALLLAPADFLIEIAERLEADGIQAAVAARDGEPLFNWMMPLVALQGISDRAAFAFNDRMGGVTWREIADAVARRPTCPKLRCHWNFADCGYRKDALCCSEPDHLPFCPLPQFPLRKGTLNVAAFGLWLFLRDVAGGDLVSWIDARLAAADPGRRARGRAAAMQAALLEPLCEIAGVGPKLWSMILAELLLVGDPNREQWVFTGGSMIAVDSLVHAFLQRTGSLRRCGADHPYGPRCYEPGGCADVIAALAEAADAREFNPAFPKVFPRFVQHAVWLFCAEWGRDLCNGRQIDDAQGCVQAFCPAGPSCDRLPLRS